MQISKSSVGITDHTVETLGVLPLRCNNNNSSSSNNSNNNSNNNTNNNDDDNEADKEMKKTHITYTTSINFCAANMCAQVPVLQYAVLDSYLAIQGSVVHYTCIDGFVPSTVSSLSTECDGIIWTPAQPFGCEGATSFLLSNQCLSNFNVARGISLFINVINQTTG